MCSYTHILNINTITMMTPDEWRLCQMLTHKKSTGDLLSDEMDLAEECHMKLEEDDEVSIALKEINRERKAQQQQKILVGHKRTPSDLTDVTQAMSEDDLSFLDLSFLDENLVAERTAEDVIIENPIVFTEDDDFEIVNGCSRESSFELLQQNCLENEDAFETVMPSFLCCS